MCMASLIFNWRLVEAEWRILRHIVADTSLPIMFLGLGKLGNICCGHKIFLNKIWNIFCVRNKFCARGQTEKHLCRQQRVRNNVSSFTRARLKTISSEQRKRQFSEIKHVLNGWKANRKLSVVFFGFKSRVLSDSRDRSQPPVITKLLERKRAITFVKQHCFKAFTAWNPKFTTL